MTFDELDERIVAALVDNARATYAEVGAGVGLSAPAVKRRVDRLRASGAITGFSARVDPAALGWTTEAYVELFCGGRTSPEGIGAEPFVQRTRSVIVLSRLIERADSFAPPAKA